MLYLGRFNNSIPTSVCAIRTLREITSEFLCFFTQRFYNDFMIKKTAKHKTYPIRHYIKVMMLVSFTVLILDLGISIASISIVKQQSTRNLQDTAALYINRINHDFAYINHYMGWTLGNDESLLTMNTYGVNSIEFLKANDNLFKRFTELQKLRA